MRRGSIALVACLAGLLYALGALTRVVGGLLNEFSNACLIGAEEIWASAIARRRQ